jgi:diguanylate cyclase (GGDEF)-like protein
VGRNQAEVLPPPISDALDDVIHSNAAAAESREIHVAVSELEEVILEITATASALDQDGDRAGVEPSMVGCVTFVDVTEKRRLEARTAQLAWYDGLTGLPNRNYFTDALRAAIREVRERGGKSALLFFDIDRFKNVNDTLGHHFGDLLLAAVAKRAQEALDESGLLVRLGGDEFAVIAPDLNHAEIAVLAKQIITALSAPFMLEGYRVAVGASAGIALIGPGDDDPGAVMKQADLALHAAKSDGSGHRFFDPDMDDNLDERRQIEVALWDALQSGQLEIEYQPQVDITTGRVLGVEALSRWIHTDFGEVPPDRFVPIAEATGLIDQIGSAVLMRACRAVAPLGDLTLSVNVSAVQFARGDLIGAVSAALAASKLEPSRLELEITETVFLGSGDLVRQKMNDLKKLGVTFALDDFGTGFSSLNYVREFPFDVIKIDRGFVSRLLVDPGSAAIVRAVLAMAEGLDKRVVAEGIESEDQRRMLALLGCKEGQGFLFGRAVPIAELVRQLAGSTELPRQLSA